MSPPLCHFCGAQGTLYHMVGGCTESPLRESSNPYHTPELRESALASSSLASQRQLVARVVDAAKAYGFLERGDHPEDNS